MEDVLCWRRATYDECAKVEKMAIKAKNSKLLAIVGYGLLVLIFVILLVPLTIYYNGIVLGILFGVIGTLFTVGACCFIYLPSRKRMALITEKNLEVTEGVVLDRKTVISKHDRHDYYVTLRLGDEINQKEKELRIHESVYDECVLDTKVLLIRYDKEGYLDGFCDVYDVITQ